jgi:hypothetical protein
MVWNMACPALPGRYLSTESRIEVGNAAAIAGSTRISPKTEAMAPAVLRMMVPKPTANTPSRPR